MAKSVYDSSGHESGPERVIVYAGAGPTFGQGVKFILFGFALGFGAAYYFLGGISRRSVAAKAKNKAARKASEATQSVLESVEDTVEAAGEAVEDRLHSLATRVRDISSRAKDVIEGAAAAARPALERAVAEGKKTASDVQEKLKKEVSAAGDRPALAEEDGTLENSPQPSEKEDKFVE